MQPDDIKASTDVRLDKWLWSVRLFKKRPDATDACHAGRVKVNGHEAKAARHLREGDEIEFRVKSVKHVVVVKELINKRVSAEKAAPCYEDRSPKVDPEMMPSAFYQPTTRRGEGRPTKKKRRDMERGRGMG